MTDKSRVPHRRYTGLAIGFAVSRDQELFYGLARDRALGMVYAIAQRGIHHHAVGHGGIDRPQPVLAVQPFGYEGDAGFDGALVQSLRPERYKEFQPAIEDSEKSRPIPVLVRGSPPDRRAAREEEFPHMDPAGIVGYRLQSGQHH